jgi:hypothetical protein
MIRDYLQFLGTLWTLWRGCHDNPIVRYTRVRGGWRRDWATIIMVPLALVFFAAPWVALALMVAYVGSLSALAADPLRGGAQDLGIGYLITSFLASWITGIALPILFLAGMPHWRRRDELEEFYFTQLSAREIAFGSLYKPVRALLVLVAAMLFNAASCFAFLYFVLRDEVTPKLIAVLVPIAVVPTVLMVGTLLVQVLHTPRWRWAAWPGTWLWFAAWMGLWILGFAGFTEDKFWPMVGYAVWACVIVVLRLLLLREGFRDIHTKVFAPLFPEEFARRWWLEQHRISLTTWDIRGWFLEFAAAWRTVWRSMLLGGFLGALGTGVMLLVVWNLPTTPGADSYFLARIEQRQHALATGGVISLTLAGMALGAISLRTVRGAKRLPAMPRPAIIVLGIMPFATLLLGCLLALLMVVFSAAFEGGNLGRDLAAAFFYTSLFVNALWVGGWTVLASVGAMRSTAMAAIWNVAAPVAIVGIEFFYLAGGGFSMGQGPEAVFSLLMIHPAMNALLLPLWLDRRTRHDAEKLSEEDAV